MRPQLLYDAFRLPLNRRSSKSPSASHLLALINWTTLITCFPNMMGNDTMAAIHGIVESILFARAISMAPADHGEVKSRDGFGAGGLLSTVAGVIPERGSRSCGDNIGDEKERRYRAMKNISLRAQKVNRTA